MFPALLDAPLSRIVASAFHCGSSTGLGLSRSGAISAMASFHPFVSARIRATSLGWLRSGACAGLSVGVQANRGDRRQHPHSHSMAPSGMGDASSPKMPEALRVDADVLLGYGPCTHTLWESLLISNAPAAEEDPLGPRLPGDRASETEDELDVEMERMLEQYFAMVSPAGTTREGGVAVLLSEGSAPGIEVPEHAWLDADHPAPVDLSKVAAPAGAREGEAEGAGGDGAERAGAPVLELVVGVANMPHPDKLAKGGEDAWFVSDDSACFGVADGVGGWAEHGVDAAEYARELMRHCAEALALEAPCGEAGKRALKRAHLKTRALGSSTACLGLLCGDTLHVVNVGDSGVSVVRDGEIVFSTPPQQHDFNFPYQMGSDGVSDPPESAQEFKVQLKPGDVVLAATDGLWDNLWGNEIVDLVGEAQKRGKSPKALANVMAKQAQKRGMDQTAWSPFMHGALQRGFAYMGGKLDDITIVCSYVRAPSRL